ncbi:MAG: ArsB/NhaD family transporter [Desulfosporosinus sp.]|nr:ArsB/NhaD family transporter [Desulfosporosinus sp.]
MSLFLLWRPHGLNESIPPTICALFIFLAGIVPLSDIFKIMGIVSGASITILSTCVMSIVLDSIGFFRLAAFNLINRANGSGILLYWYINLLCLLMTLFFNNDGSILITTPIIINVVTILSLRANQRFPYLLSGALIAIASSAPIAVSNLANLIVLKTVGLDLNLYVAMMFVPSMMGITAISLLLFYYFRQDIPKNIMVLPVAYIDEIHSDASSSIPRFSLEDKAHPRHLHLIVDKAHPGHLPLILDNAIHSPVIDRSMFKVCIAIIVLIRAGLFLGDSVGIPTEWIGIIGALLLMGYRWHRKGVGANDIVKKTPWHFILYAFSSYVVIYALYNSGFTGVLLKHLREPIATNHLSACLISGSLLTVMSNVFNNIPSVLIGTFTFTGMGLDIPTLHIAYLANILGADIGSLITPLGTLAYLLWIFLLRKSGIRVSWADSLKVTIMVIPIGLLISLLSLYFWVEWLFF